MVATTVVLSARTGLSGEASDWSFTSRPRPSYGLHWSCKSSANEQSGLHARAERDEKRAAALREDLYRQMRASVCFEFSEYYKCLYIIIIECYYSLCQRFDLLHLVLDRLARILAGRIIWATVFLAGVSLLTVVATWHGSASLIWQACASVKVLYLAFDQFNLFHHGLAFK